MTAVVSLSTPFSAVQGFSLSLSVSLLLFKREEIVPVVAPVFNRRAIRREESEQIKFALSPAFDDEKWAKSFISPHFNLPARHSAL
jgi:hypothetical protein